MKKHLVLGALAAFAALACAESASAHARMSPPVALANEGQVFTLAVPTEKEGATTTSIELTPQTGFSIDSFVPAPGWKRTVQQTGSGEEAVITKVTWSGGAVPTGLGTAAASTLAFILPGHALVGLGVSAITAGARGSPASCPVGSEREPGGS